MMNDSSVARIRAIYRITKLYDCRCCQLPLMGYKKIQTVEVRLGKIQVSNRVLT